MMNITLLVVRQTRKDALGFDSFTASFITAEGIASAGSSIGTPRHLTT